MDDCTVVVVVVVVVLCSVLKLHRFFFSRAITRSCNRKEVINPNDKRERF